MEVLGLNKSNLGVKIRNSTLDPDLVLQSRTYVTFTNTNPA